MKRDLVCFFSLASFIFFSASSVAQSFGGGAIAGACTSQMDGDKMSGYHVVGLVLGCNVTRELHHKLIGLLEMRFVQKGAASTLSKHKRRLDYFAVPFLCRYMVRNTVGIEAGFEPSFLFYDNREKYAYTNNDVLPIFDLPLAIGFHYMPFKRLSFNTRYSYSSFRVSSYYNNSIQIAAYYSLK